MLKIKLFCISFHVVWSFVLIFIAMQSLNLIWYNHDLHLCGIACVAQSRMLSSINNFDGWPMLLLYLKPFMLAYSYSTYVPSILADIMFYFNVSGTGEVFTDLHGFWRPLWWSINQVNSGSCGSFKACMNDLLLLFSLNWRNSCTS